MVSYKILKRCSFRFVVKRSVLSHPRVLMSEASKRRREKEADREQ